MTQPTILIVEDDERLAAMVAAYLQRHGYKVSVEARSERAAERILTEQPAVVVLDGTVPLDEELTMAGRARVEWNGAVVMFTGRSQSRAEVQSLGADGYVPKPVNPRVLLARVDAVLRRDSRYESPRVPPPSALHVLARPESVPARRSSTLRRPVVHISYTPSGFSRFQRSGPRTHR